MSEIQRKQKSIFESASEIEKARAHKKDSPKKEEVEEVSVIGEIVQRGQKLHEELASRVDRLFSANKIVPSAYRKYLSRPQNFSAQDWQRLEEQKKKNEELLKDLAGKIGVKTPPPPEQKKEKPLEKKVLSKKAKIVTKRHWIGM